MTEPSIVTDASPQHVEPYYVPRGECEPVYVGPCDAADADWRGDTEAFIAAFCAEDT